MKSITSISCALLAVAHLVSAAPAPSTSVTAPQTVQVSYDQKYDVGTASPNTTACSDGVYGLIGEYPTFGSLPSFPLIGGALTIGGWNSPACGTCYQLHFESGNINETINVTAIDTAPGGFNIGLTAMNRLTNNQAVSLGVVTATYVEVDKSVCGMS